MIKKIALSNLDTHELEKIEVDPATQEDDFFDYSKVIVKKPWGHEYLIYQNEQVAVWILYIKKGFQTSTHCHPNKKTSLIVLSGKARCSSLAEAVERNAGDGLLIDKGVFHSTESISDEGIFVMEIETPVNKRDLVRLKDKYGRVGSGYETVDQMSYNLRNYNYISLIEPKVYYNVTKKFGKCSISVFKYKDDNDFRDNFKLEGWDAVSILKGKICDGNNQVIVNVGDTLDLEQIKSYQNISIDEETEILTIQKRDNMVKISDYVASFLEKEDLNTIFLVPGSANMHLLDSIGRNTHLQHISTQTEQAATVAAEGYAKATGNTGVSIISSGVAGANALSGIADSWVDSSPMLVLSGQAQSNQTVGSSTLRQLGIQELDITRIVVPITKYAVKIENPYMIRYHLEKALFLAREGRPGPVWVDIPIDVQGMKINEEELIAFDPLEVKRNHDLGIISEDFQEQVTEVFNLLNQSKRPVMLIGNGVRLAKAEEELLSVISALHIPLLVSRRGADLIEESNPLFFGRPGAYGQRSANFIIQNADLILSLGSRLSLPQIGRNYKAFARGAKKIVVDIDRKELEKKTIKPDMAIHCSCKEFLNGMLKDLYLYQRPEIKTWLEKCTEWKLKYETSSGQEFQESIGTEVEGSAGINAYSFFKKISAFLPEGSMVAIDGGAPMIFAMQEFKFKKNQRLISATGLENSSFALPASIGACVGSNGRQITCICEDSGFQKNIPELETICSYNLPIKIFILNCQGYGYLKRIQEEYFGSRYVASTRESDPAKIAEAYGIPVFEMRNEADLETINHVLKMNGPVICKVNINKGQQITPRITFTVKPDGKWLAKPLEDMYPFMDRRELEQNMIVDLVKEE